jgi:hypothetical protein
VNAVGFIGRKESARVSDARHAFLWSDLRAQLSSNRHAFGAQPSQTRESTAGIVTTEGGGFVPTLDVGGGAGLSRASGPGSS